MVSKTRKDCTPGCHLRSVLADLLQGPVVLSHLIEHSRLDHISIRVQNQKSALFFPAFLLDSHRGPFHSNFERLLVALPCLGGAFLSIPVA